jgi:predicted  nucleic acid-binding Zn-ribbon protein
MRVITVSTMTNEELFEDLKQLIVATVTQQTSDVRRDIADVKDNVAALEASIADVKHDITGIKHDLVRLECKVDNGFAGIGTTVEIINQQIDEVDTQLMKLEHRAA